MELGLTYFLLLIGKVDKVERGWLKIVAALDPSPLGILPIGES